MHCRQTSEHCGQYPPARREVAEFEYSGSVNNEGGSVCRLYSDNCTGVQWVSLLDVPREPR
jgi:hypothetical protein